MRHSGHVFLVNKDTGAHVRPVNKENHQLLSPRRLCNFPLTNLCRETKPKTHLRRWEHNVLMNAESKILYRTERVSTLDLPYSLF